MIWLYPWSKRGLHSRVVSPPRLTNRLFSLASSSSTKAQARVTESPITRSHRNSPKSGYSQAMRSKRTISGSIIRGLFPGLGERLQRLVSDQVVHLGLLPFGGGEDRPETLVDRHQTEFGVGAKLLDLMRGPISAWDAFDRPQPIGNF